MNAEAEVAKPKEPGTLRLIFTLGLAGLVAGLLLVGVYLGTLNRIKHNQDEALKKAVYQVVPGSREMQKLVWTGDKLVTDPKAKGEAIYAAYDANGKFMGYAIPGEGPGFQDTIKLIYGYDPAKKIIIGMAVLESRETPGLGDKIDKDPAFKANFKALAVEPSVVAVKHGTKTAPNQIDAITGATISSKAVGKIIAHTDDMWLPRLPPAGQEPAYEGAKAPAQGGAK